MIELLLLVLIIVALYSINTPTTHILHNVEGFGAAPTTNEAIQDISSVYNKGNMIVTNLKATGNTELGNVTSSGNISGKAFTGSSMKAGIVNLGIPLSHVPKIGQGTYITWNDPCCTGATTIANHRGGGAGGFRFVDYDKNGQNPKLLVSIDGNGTMSIAGNLNIGGNLNVGGTLNVGKNINAGGKIRGR